MGRCGTAVKLTSVLLLPRSVPSMKEKRAEELTSGFTLRREFIQRQFPENLLSWTESTPGPVHKSILHQ